MHRPMSRRGFLAAAGASASAFTIVPGRALGLGGNVAANSRINVAFIGVGSQGLRVMCDFLEQPDVQAVAVADPVRSAANYPPVGQERVPQPRPQAPGRRFGLGMAEPERPDAPA